MSKEPSPGETMIDDILTIRYPINKEFFIKLFMKIAFTHIIQQLNIKIINDPIMNWIRNYLKRGHIEDKILSMCNDNLDDNSINELFRKSIVKDKQVFWWRDNLQESKEKIKFKSRIFYLPIYGELNKILDKHLNEFRTAKRLAIIDKSGDIDNELRSQVDNYRYHSITLKHNIIAKGTYCKIQLFGGIFDVSIRIAAALYPIEDKHDMKICF